jgi:hypothetical protein
MRLETKLYRCKLLEDGEVRLYARVNKQLAHTQYVVCPGDAHPIEDEHTGRVQVFDSLASAQGAVAHARAKLATSAARPAQGRRGRRAKA